MSTARQGVEYTLIYPEPRPPLTTNEYKKAHYRKQHAAKLHVEASIGWLARAQRIPELSRSDVLVTWFAPTNGRRDPDSPMAFLKMALDGLVKAGVWPDDNARFVRETATRVEVDRVNPRLEVRIVEVSDAVA